MAENDAGKKAKEEPPHFIIPPREVLGYPLDGGLTPLTLSEPRNLTELLKKGPKDPKQKGTTEIGRK
jgi:hypothetical protein